MNYIDEIAAEIRQHLPDETLPDEDGIDGLLRLYALLVLVRGTDVDAEDVHDAWSVWMAQKEPTHESLRPFADLDSATRREDKPFVDAIREVATHRTR